MWLKCHENHKENKNRHTIQHKMNSNMKTLLFLAVMIIMPVYIYPVSQSGGDKPINYLEFVKTSADNLLKHGTDRYGTRNTAIWAGIIDTRDYSVPENGVPATEGVRSYDRAQGGGNLYHDVTTLKVFHALSELLETDIYQKAVSAYLSDYLEYAQSPYNGLLGWGEHLYYHFYRDSVMLDEERVNSRGITYYPHELLGWTPPWGLLWESDAERTTKAIEGLQYHYNGPDPKVYLFTRHANYFKAEYQDYVMPWIKHTGLYAYSYAFLYNKTGDSEALYWSRETGNLYWKLRDPETNLTLSCLFHGSNPSKGKNSSMGTSSLAYWLYKAYELTGDQDQRMKALELMLALDKYHWNNEKKKYYSSLPLDGIPDENSVLSTAWKIGYSSSSILPFGRVAAYLSTQEDNPGFFVMARRTASILNQEDLPDEFTAENIADAMNLNLDLFDLTGEEEYLDAAEVFAGKAIDELWKDGMFARQNGGDHYYEAKLGIGDLLGAFLRLHLSLNSEISLSNTYDWSR